MVGKAEIGVVMVGLPIIYELETNDNIDWTRIILFTILGVGGLSLIHEGKSTTLQKAPAEVLNHFDTVFDELEELTWSP